MSTFKTQQAFSSRRLRVAAIAVGFLAVGLAGCRGGGRVEFIALSYTAIDPPSPAVTRLELDGCYWWTDEQDQLWIAMERDFSPLLFPIARMTFRMSLALEKPPAGPARNYELGQRELRAVVRLGPVESRFTSRVGIVAIYRKSGARLRGSLRIEASREVYAVFGWSRPSRMLMLGTFEAVRDEGRGRAIAEATEAQGWSREARAGPRRISTFPATQPGEAGR